jgi:transcriptional regulator with GAF, ATPase, and Fis domain
LRVLQERTFEPVGDDRTRRVDVRVIAATNRPLEVEVESGRFRRDLFYRLSVVPIVVPPLRERREDILPMARQFLQATAARLHLPLTSLSAADEARLQAYDFPGNVRELQNLIERALVLASHEGAGLKLHLGKNGLPVVPLASQPVGEDPAEVLSEQHFQALERLNIENALNRCDGRIAGGRGAAQLLGLSPSTLSYRMKQLGVARPAKR